MSAGHHELLLQLGESVVGVLVGSLGVSREFVRPARKFNLDAGQRSRGASCRARPRISAVLDVRQRSSVVGCDPVAKFQVEIEERAARLGHEGQEREAVRFDQPVDGLAEALGACALLATEFVLLQRGRNLRKIIHTQRRRTEWSRESLEGLTV